MKKSKKKKSRFLKQLTEHESFVINDEIWLTTEEAMAYLKVSRSTIYRLRKKHNIPNFKLGSIPLFPKNILTKYLINQSISNLKKD